MCREDLAYPQTHFSYHRPNRAKYAVSGNIRGIYKKSQVILTFVQSSVENEKTQVHIEPGSINAKEIYLGAFFVSQAEIWVRLAGEIFGAPTVSIFMK